MANLKEQYQSLTVDELEKVLKEGVLTPEARDLCKSVINEKTGTRKYDVASPDVLENKVENQIQETTSNDYRTSITVAKFISFVGWLMCVGAIILIITAFAGAGRMGALAIAPGLGVFIGGLILVIAGQTSRAVMDNTNYSKQILELMRKTA